MAILLVGVLECHRRQLAHPSAVKHVASFHLFQPIPERADEGGACTRPARLDVVAEYEATKRKADDIGGASVVLIKGSDIKKGRDETSDHLSWYIFAVDFSSQSDAEDWCQDLYPRLSGNRLRNVCCATQLKPPAALVRAKRREFWCRPTTSR